jgi:multicomponent Na+:H+ antiporter subunit F
MNIWMLVAAVLLVGVMPCGAVCLRRSPVEALVGLEAATMVLVLVLLVLSVGFDRSIYADVAVVMAVLSFAGGMVFARFMERWG